MAEIRREYNFRSEKSFFDNKKVILASLNTNSGVNEFYDVLSLKIEQRIF